MSTQGQREKFVPNNLREFFQSLYSAELSRFSVSPAALPAPIDPILISVVRNESEILADFFKHYRNHGIKRFVLVDNGSDDGTFQFLQGQRDVDLYSSTVPFSTVRKQGWINYLICLYGYGRWYLIVDADEHVCFDGIENHQFSELVQLFERDDLRIVRGFLLDMYGRGPLQMLSSDGRGLRERFDLFDRAPYVERTMPEMVSCRGGARSRIFSSDTTDTGPELTKYPLVRLVPGEFAVSPHYIWPVSSQAFSPRRLAILHYKFSENFPKKMNDALLRKQYWNESQEYRAYHRVLSENADLSFEYAGSCPLSDSRTLIDLGLVERLDWRSTS